MTQQSKRTVQDDEEQQLLDEGWEFSGLGLFKHPALAPKFDSKSYTKQQALEMNMGEHYRNIQKEWDIMHNFIEQFADPYMYLDRYKLADETKQLLETINA